MRAARTALHLPALLQLRTKEPKRKTVSARQPDCVVWLGAAFLAGYLPGIWLGRDGTTALGQQLAAWYTESPRRHSFCGGFRGTVCGGGIAALRSAFVRVLHLGHWLAGVVFCGARGISRLLCGLRGSG